MTIKEKLAKLINIKSIVTILTTIVFCYLAIIEKVTADQFMLVFTTIIAFYYGTQLKEKEKSE